MDTIWKWVKNIIVFVVLGIAVVGTLAFLRQRKVERSGDRIQGHIDEVSGGVESLSGRVSEASDASDRIADEVRDTVEQSEPISDRLADADRRTQTTLERLEEANKRFAELLGAGD